VPGSADFSGSATLTAFIDPPVVASEEQMRYLIQTISGDSSAKIPWASLTINLLPNTTQTQILELTSSLETVLESDSNAYTFNAREVRASVEQTTGGIQLFLAVIACLLTTLTFLQLVLSVEGNLRDQQWQIGVLRAMGMKKTDIRHVTLMEASAHILAAALIGFATGYVASVTSTSVLQKSQDRDVDYSIDWQALLVIIAVSYSLVWVSTRICVE